MTAKIWDAKTGRLALEITKHQESVTAAAFIPGNDFRILTAAVDKLVILWEIRAISSSAMMSDNSSGPIAYEAIELARVETRNYLDIAVASNRIVTMGQSHFQVFNLPQKAFDPFKEALEDSEHSYEVEMSDTVTSIALSKDGR